MNNFIDSSFGLLENDVDYYILEDWRNVSFETTYCVSYLTQDPVNFSWIEFEKYLNSVYTLYYTVNTSKAVGNQVSPDSSVGVWNIISVFFWMFINYYSIYNHFVFRVSKEDRVPGVQSKTKTKARQTTSG